MAENRIRYLRAVALDYNQLLNAAPVLAVNASNNLADQVVKLAKRFNVPIVERPELARALSALEVDESIPEGLFEAVAIVLNEVEKGLRYQRGTRH